MRYVFTLIATVSMSVAIPQGSLHEFAFVGCPADGQVGPIDPPRGESKRVTSDEPAIAYYKGEQAPGAFAPAGWRCRAWYGSSGAHLIVTPQSIDPPYFPPPAFQGDAVEISINNGSTSGRWEVAEKAAQFFPSAGSKFIERVNESLDTKIVVGRPPRYPNVRNLSDVTAEFTTPPNTSGIGTEGYLRPSQNPVSGVMVLDQSTPEEPNLLIVRIRLQPSQDRLKSELLRLNRQCMENPSSC